MLGIWFVSVQECALLVSKVFMPSVSHAAEERDETVSVGIRPTQAGKLLGKYKYVLYVCGDSCDKVALRHLS